MGFPTDGFVLRPPRTANGNARTTGTAITGVPRDHKALPATHTFFDSASDLIEIAADMYRAAVLDNPNADQEEYLVWAANSASLSVIEDPDWAVEAEDPSAAVTIPRGTLDVEDTTTPDDPSDGADRLVVLDPGGRGLAEVRLITIVRGDTGAEVQVGPEALAGPAFDFDSQDADAGLVTLSVTALAVLDGGVSRRRGDSISFAKYVLSAARFWWSKNDRALTRFGWNGKVQRWEPRKGSAPRDLGVLTEDAAFVLFPRPSRFTTGDTLPGDPGDPDVFTLIRLGIRPDATSTVPEVQVISDVVAEEGTVDFVGLGDPDAVVGQGNGILIFNPTFIATNAGQTVWYNPEQYEKDSNGEIGDLKAAFSDPLFLSPVPGPTERPFVRLGFRRHLTPFAVINDAALPAQSGVTEGTFYWSMTTGRLALSESDILKADPDDTLGNFDIQYLGNKVYFDGVSLTTTSLRTPDPLHLVDDTGTEVGVPSSGLMFIRDAVPLPFPGVSGIRHTPDNTGQAPDASVTPATRENDSGLVRKVDGFGDTFIFSVTKAFDETEIVEFQEDTTSFPFAMRKTKAQIARERIAGEPGSAVQFKRSGIKDEAIYFLQSEVMPAVYMSQARMYSREMGPFTFEGGEKLYFAIDGTKHTWTATAGTYTAAALAADITASSAPPVSLGTVTAVRDRIVIESATPATGTVEIGFGTSTALGDRDFSGGAVIGFLPGWRVDATASENWLPDNGSVLGVSRSPQNRSRTGDDPDFRARGMFDNVVLSESLIANPHFPINNPPLQDVAGHDDNVFFMVADGLSLNFLKNLTEVFYDFANDRFTWLERGNVATRIQQISGALSLGNAGVIPITLHEAVATGFGFRLAEDGEVFVDQVQGVDFLIPDGGSTGLALPIEVIGGEVAEGAAGSFAISTATFSDVNASFITDGVDAGYRLHIILGDAKGSYIVASVTSETVLEVEAAVPFPSDGGPANGASYVSWRLHTGIVESAYDPAVVADVLYDQFNHLQEEPFKIRLLNNLGATPTSPAAQLASRLVAIVTDAFQRGRVISVRFGLTFGNDEATLTPLDRGVLLGEMANGSLFVPDVADIHFTTEKFSIRVGSKTYTIGTDLTVVAAFGPLTGDEVEVLSTTGEVGFGATTLSDLEGADVVYDEEFLDATDLADGEAEYNPADGELNISDADISAHGGETAYFVERMITENALDVRVSPVIGSFFFNRSLREGQIVEASYFEADSQGALTTGTEITEFLSLIVRQETATLVDPFTYTVNPTGRTIAQAVETLIWVDNSLQNFGNAEDVTFDNGTLTFNEEVVATAVVQVNYAVFEAFGGEQAYNTSTIPVYRPPFFLEAEQVLFVLEGDRTADMVPGKLLRLGAQPFYIKSSTYNPSTDGTSIEVFPPSDVEAGSRAPGNDVLTLISSVPVTNTVDSVPTGYAPATGFLLPLTGVTYEPVDKGMIDIVFHGDVTRFAVAGHLLEMDGHPFIIAAAQIAGDGRTTLVSLTSPALRGFNSSTDPVRLSVRPIYQPAAREFLGIAPFVATQETELVLFGETDGVSELPGRTLVQDVHYTVNADDGSITLLEPIQAPLGTGQRLLFGYTRLKVLGPFRKDGAVVYPRYRAGYSFITSPSEENGRLGTTLVAKYTFHSPDSFYYRTVPLQTYMGEVSKIAVGRVQSQSPAGGAIVVSGASTNNFDQGRFGFEAERRDILDQDRAARAFISLYNEVVIAFEQVSEAITGEVVGDRDGKFRFFVGRGKTYAPQGYEDEIMGDLNARFIWSLVFRAANEVFGVDRADPVVLPETATIPDPTTGEVEGDQMDPFVLDFYIKEQKRYIRNDMDDEVLTGTKNPFFLAGFPFGGAKTDGQFDPMWKPHNLSRLFPEVALAFTTTLPGLEPDLEATPINPGVYSFLKVLAPPKLFRKDKDDDTPVIGSTFLRMIGPVANPVLGVITDLSDVTTRERLPRARIWAYSADGFPDIDAAVGTATAGFATIIATPGFIKDFPVDPETGLPDFDRLLSEDTVDSDTEDLVTGHAELSVPGFKGVDTDVKPPVRQQVAFGRPTGETYAVGNAQQTLSSFFSLDVDPIYGGVFVGSVEKGCIIILADDKGDPIAGSDVLAIGEGELSGEPIVLNQGDTIYVTLPASKDATEMDDPPTAEQLEEFADAIPTLDVGLKRRRGLWMDISMPSKNDPNFPFKEMLSQKTPFPLQTIEGDVEFRNSNRDPTEIPALKGEPTNDSGDFSIPFLSFGNTELDRLGEVATSFIGLSQVDAPANSQSVYPNEVIVDDGEILDVSDGVRAPAVLHTATSDLTPVTTAGSYPANSGIGDVKRYDILLVEVPNSASGIQVGATGILTVGDVTTTTVEVPRFVTQSFPGDPNHYTFDRAMVHVSSIFVTGMVVSFALGVTTFDITTTGAPFFNDGTATVSLTGGLNNIFAIANAIVIRLYENGGGGSPGSLIEEIVITGTGGFAHGSTAADEPILAIFADEKKILVTTALPFVTNTGVTYDFEITIDTWIDATTDATITGLGGTSLGVGGGTGSTTGWVGEDRLTFNERFDMTTAPERGTLRADGVTVISAGLSVWRVTGDGGTLISVNAPGVVNGGFPLTFLSADGLGTVGTFAAASAGGAGDELGTIRAMSWEAENIPVGPVTPVVVAGVPSSDEDENGTICNGTGEHHDDETSVVAITTASGAVSNVVSGDVLIIKKSATSKAAVSAGTFLVRHAIEENVAGYREVALSGSAGAGGQFFDGTFATITAFNEGALEVTVTTLGVGPATSTNGTLWDLDTTGANLFGASGMIRLHVIPNAGNPNTVVSMEIASINTLTNTFTLSTGTAEDHKGNPLGSDADFFAVLQTGQKVSGFRFIPIGTSGSALGSGLPSNSVVGHDHGTTTTYGFRHLVISNAGLVGDASTATGDNATFALASIIDGGVADGSEDIGVIEADVVDNKDFQANQEAVVYVEVAGWFDLNGLPTSGGATDWEEIHGLSDDATPVSLDGVRCLFPGDKFVAGNEVTETGAFKSNTGLIGFRAEAGIFTEPSWPRPVRQLDEVVPHVVDAGNSATTDFQIGMRNPTTFLFTSPEPVTFEVRRIRRFHDALEAITGNLEPLRFAYEIRRGEAASYTAATRTFVATTPTQFGDFESKDVNIHPGDEVRLLDADGEVVDAAEIAVVVDGSTLVFRKPGFAQVAAADVGTVYIDFEVYLNQAPVPHEQSNEQLLSIITEELVYETVANPTTGDGGRVDVFNQLKDTTVADFTALGIQVGDVVLIDPAGDLEGPTGPATTPEQGSRPFGDQSVPGRGPGLPYDDGQPFELDDNRGFYRVVEVLSTHLVVSGASEFSGEDGSDVTFGSGSTEYAVLPTISGSTTPTSGAGDTEGQQDLRPTAPAGASSLDPNSYKGNQQSIEPFSYRIIRPTTLLANESIDLVLFIRERMLSWLEEMETPMAGGKSGDYYIFQRDEHISDVGSTTIPDDGLGIIHNSFVTGLAGVTDTSPFANTSDCLSVLDRRFWVLDHRLDSEVPPFSGGIPYSTFEDGDGRPVLPDLVSGVLDVEDRLRQLRFAWVRFRSERVNGTLMAVQRFDLDLPRRLKEQEDLLRMQEGLDKT